MAHQRKLIRAAVVNRLKADLPTYAAKIFPNRIMPLYQAMLPCILVYTSKENSQIYVQAPREYERDLQVIIEIVAKADANLDDTLDDICELVEASIFREETFGGLVTDTLLSETEVVLMGEGEKSIGAAQITFSMPYYTKLPDDLTGPLDAFTKAHTDIDINGDGVIESTDDIILPQ